MDSWLLEALKQGGFFALAALAIYYLNKLWRDRIEAEKFYREALEKQFARDKEELMQMWKQTWEALENNTRVFSIFMERYNSQQSNPRSASRSVLSRPRPPEDDDA